MIGEDLMRLGRPDRALVAFGRALDEARTGSAEDLQIGWSLVNRGHAKLGTGDAVAAEADRRAGLQIRNIWGTPVRSSSVPCSGARPPGHDAWPGAAGRYARRAAARPAERVRAFDLPWQDLALSWVVYRRAAAAGVGTRIDLLA